MATIENKMVTVESLKEVHDHSKNTYMTKSDPTGTGSFSVNRKIDTTVGDYSTAIGDDTTASGLGSYAEGFDTVASSDYQHVQGKYNIEDVDDIYAHIVGNGNADDERSNAHTLTWEGDAWYAGDFSADGNIILSSNQYGDELPAAGIVGRIFFKRLLE